ncbi:DUF4411 family protein [Inquilinus limosus]|uniref:DNA-binding protein n=1 Tax=Inquilinus limosus TaxID=171674 RepID=A0A211Z6B5_9PROT|nr:DUF4411 family protein [Inquilinus limosus]OWJ60801.1 DNA-binding protein [Inquilinus limosus]
MTLYLLDANVLIRAHGDYYPIDRIPQFWVWLYGRAAAGIIKMPGQIYDEVAQSIDMLGDWLHDTDVKRALILAEPTNPTMVQRVIEHGYAPNLNDIEIATVGRDPFLIAAALCGPDRVVVTREVSRPSAQRQNRHIPDVCGTFGVASMNDFALYRELQFRIE